MQKIPLERTDLAACVAIAQSEGIVLTRNGNPVALVVGIESLDDEQVQLGASDKFWKLIQKRRKEKSVSRNVLEAKVKRRIANSRRK